MIKLLTLGCVMPGNLDFLRNDQHFQAFCAMVQANPQILQPMLQELGKQNPPLVTLQEPQADFLCIYILKEETLGELRFVGPLFALIRDMGAPSSKSSTPKKGSSYANPYGSRDWKQSNMQGENGH